MADLRDARSQLQVRPRRGRTGVHGAVPHLHAGLHAGLPAGPKTPPGIPPRPPAGLPALHAAEPRPPVRAGISEAPARSGRAGVAARVNGYRSLMTLPVTRTLQPVRAATEEESCRMPRLSNSRTVSTGWKVRVTGVSYA